MKKKITIGTGLTILFISLTVCFCLTILLATRLFESKIESVNAKETLYDKISDIDSMVRQNYYATPDSDRILESLSAGYINGLDDDESRYLTSDEYMHYQDILSGKIFGVGFSVVKSKEDSGYMKVYGVIDNSPAAERGIENGDLITSIDGVSTINMSEATAQDALLGLMGDTVEIGYIHDGAEYSTVLTNRSYDVPSMIYSKEKESGYIRISGFQQKTASELEYAVNSLIAQGITSLVIDLRQNSSQDYDAAAEAADIILTEGTTMYAVYKDGERKVLYTSDKSGVNLPLIVITNERTGYAAEMFAMMLKDCAGAKIVGTTTMGKGSLQKIFRLSDGSGIELTVALLSPVSSSSYHRTGITPDYEKTLEDELAQRFYDLSITEDTQIQRALEVAQNIVNGNREIPPDISEQGEPVEGEEGEEDPDNAQAKEAEETEETEEESTSSEDTQSSEE